MARAKSCRTCGGMGSVPHNIGREPCPTCNPEKCQRKMGHAFCACDACAVVEAREHIDGDHMCGRDWSCWCAACRRARILDPHLEIAVRFDRVAKLETRLAAVRAAKKE